MNNRKSLILSVVGVVVAAIGLFLPWYDNTQAAMNGIQIASDSGAVFVVLCYLLIAASLVLAIVIKPAQSKWAKLNVALRALFVIIGIYLLMSIKKVMTAGEQNLPVETLVGTYVVIVGWILQAFSLLGDYKTSLGNRKWSTVDLVLIVITAAIYAAALLTLSFIRLAPGTWLRPANAMQAPFGILFGIPGCLGIAIGNFISDLTQGTAPHVLVMGLLTNFLTAYIPYVAVSKANLSTRRSLVEFVVWGSFLGAILVASSIFVNVMFGLTPKAVAIAFFPTTFLNQFLPSLLLGIPLCKLLYPFVIRAGLYRGRDAARDDEKNVQLNGGE